VNRYRVLPWLMLAVWTSWLTALQALCVTHVGLGRWVPDIGLLLVATCATHFLERDALRAVWVLGLARIAFSVDPPAAILAGYLLTALCVARVRAFAEIEGRFATMSLVTVFAWGFAAWLEAVHQIHDAQSFGSAWHPASVALSALGVTWPAGVVAALFGMACGPLLVYLPGLSPLRRRRW